MAEAHSEAKVYTVSEFVQFINELLEGEIVYIEGEISRLNTKDNHLVFFTLVDKKSAVDCFSLDFRLKVPIEEGMRVQVMGRPGLYARSGRFRVDVYDAKPSGEGALRRAFELLKAKLEAEGLFDAERKRSLPRFPQRIGLITSADSAAYTDFLKVLRGRWGGISISLINVDVQGRRAIPAILEAFRWFNANFKKYDLIVLTRGGGSLEDLAAFNSEEVARAVFSAKLPVVAAVGHERDVSLADFVADARASTPSNAAELIVPHRREILWQVNSRIVCLEQSLDMRLSDARTSVDGHVAAIFRAVNLYSLRFLHVMKSIAYHFRLFQNSLQAFRIKSDQYIPHLLHSMHSLIERENMLLSARERVIRALSPQATLKRGYSIVFKGGTKSILRDAQDVKIRDRLDIHLARGRLKSEVTGKSI